MTQTNSPLFILRDSDVFPNDPLKIDIEWKDRPTGKVILFNEKGEIALVSNTVHNLSMLPGGGIEADEDIIEGTKRECAEETGYEIEILQTLGFTEEYRQRDSRHCISHGFYAKTLSQGSQNLTDKEKDTGLYVHWLPIDKAITLFKEQEQKVKKNEVPYYNTCFNIIRDSFFIQKANEIFVSKKER